MDVLLIHFTLLAPYRRAKQSQQLRVYSLLQKTSAVLDSLLGIWHLYEIFNSLKTNLIYFFILQSHIIQIFLTHYSFPSTQVL